MEVAKLIYAKTSEICWVAWVVQGINAIKDIIDYNDPWKKGDNIVYTDQEHLSSGHTWLVLRKKGVEIKKIKNINGKIMVFDMEKAVDENTKIVCINSTSVGSGFTYDIKKVCKITRALGCLEIISLSES